MTITVDQGTRGYTVPASSLVGNPREKKFAVYVVRAGKARRTPVEVGQDDGTRVEILTGLSADDDVIRHPT